MCRFAANVALGNPQGLDYQSYDGDRILVAKFPYEFADPKRWDVVVFKYPGNAVQNYIKRLVGLPGETIRIRDGDLWIHEPDQPADRVRNRAQAAGEDSRHAAAGVRQRLGADDYAATCTGPPAGRRTTPTRTRSGPTART